MKRPVQKAFLFFTVFILIFCVESCQWYSLDFLLPEHDRDPAAEVIGSTPAPIVPLDITMITFNGDTVTHNPPIEFYLESPFRTANSNPVTVNSFQIADSEVTYGQWYSVYRWAIENGYSFGNPGEEGSSGYPGAAPVNPSIPVTDISYRDAVVWCNALSEYTGLSPVYRYNGIVLKKSEPWSVPAGSGKAENATVNPNANGYRLPDVKEWEYAARGGSQSLSDWNYKWSGTDEEAHIEDYAVIYYAELAHAVKPVKTKQPNRAGLYDMTGNVAEWTWSDDPANTERLLCGGTANEIINYSAIKIGDYDTHDVNSGFWGSGFRVARNADPATVPMVPAGFVKLLESTVTTPLGFENSCFHDIIAGDSSTYKTVHSFFIAENELTYNRWYEVKSWASSHGYTFAQKGREGNDGTEDAAPTSGNTEPVTGISWRDIIVWCNAASEMDGLTPVYKYEGEVLRVSQKTYMGVGSTGVVAGEGMAENATIDPDANGYRLPTRMEWEYAARGGNPLASEWFWKYAGTDESSELAEYAIMETNATSSVGLKTPNSAGLYDMLGNVAEYVQDHEPDGNINAYVLGGYYNMTDTQQIDTFTSNNYVNYSPYGGFRLARTRL